MKNLIILQTILTFFGNGLSAQNNILIEITGLVTNQEKNEPIAGVSVNIKGTVTGTITTSEGSFILRTGKSYLLL